MDFNIKKHIELLKQKKGFREKESQIEKVVYEISGVSVDNLVQVSSRGVVTLPDLSGIALVKIKMYKQKIIDTLRNKDIFICDIM